MTCPKCGSENVLVTVEQKSSKTKRKGTGLLSKIGRLALILCTCGLWLLIPKREGTNKSKIKSQTVGVCQSCGHKFDVKN